MSQGMIILLQCIGGIALFFLIIMVMDGNRFRVVEYKLYSRKVKKAHQYVVLSDLHNKAYGKENRKLLEAIEKLQPEGILIAGDILTAKPQKSYQNAIELIEKLALKYPIYYGMGNHETRLFLYPEVYGDMGECYESDLKKCGVQFLRNESLDREDNIRVTGLELERKFYKRFKKLPMEGEYLQKVLPKRKEDTFEILLAHNPDYFEEYARWGADLVLSGHVHGGMVRLPFLGGMISPACKLFPKYDGGKFERNKSVMILSRGLGMHTIPVRIFNPGELVVIKIYPEKLTNEMPSFMQA